MRLYSIPPSQPFLPGLVQSILSGAVLPGFPAAPFVPSLPTGFDPLALAALTIYVPTRRAGRALADAFTSHMGGSAAILPRIRTLGEDDERAQFLGSAEEALTPAMQPLHRRLLLARLIRFWKSQLAKGALDMAAEAGPLLPASAADALWLAGDLAALMDEATDENIELSTLAGLNVDDRLAEWWQLTRTFLAIVTEHWPAELQQLGLADAGKIRLAAAERMAQRLRAEGSPTPIIIAGAMTTAQAMVDLMQAVAALPNGAVVLPGLDLHIDDASFAAIASRAAPAAAGHPQYVMARMLGQMGVERTSVAELAGAESPRLAERESLFSEAMRPAETTELWASRAPTPAAALEGMALIEAADEAEEALAIAVAMRDALQQPGAHVALATPDRALARRVSVELERFDIAANDSAGRPLAATAPGELTLLALECALRPGEPVALLSLLKHPLVRLGLSPIEARRGARAVEIIALRGGSGAPDAASLAALYQRRLADRIAEKRPPRAFTLLSADDITLGAQVAEAVQNALEPLFALRSAAAMELAPQAAALGQVLEALATDENATPEVLYDEEPGFALANWLRELIAAPSVEFPFAPTELPDVMRALIAEQRVAPRAGLSRRVFIWGALEARLQNVDTLILGGLNEGSWPQAARADAFLSRLMRAEIMLDPPERRIGLAAHDLWMALGNPRLLLVRPERKGGAPAIASRWLQRLLAVIGPEGAGRLRHEGMVYLHHARQLDAKAETPRQRRPEPRPPLEWRPNRLSVTEVERLVRDPYAVYARRILHLHPMEPLISAPGPAERGTLLHDILAQAVHEGLDVTSDTAEEQLLVIARRCFSVAALPAEVEAVWWPRMETLARNYLVWERARNGEIRARHAELGGRFTFEHLGMTLTGYADRIDILRDGSAAIIDFKTGTEPTAKQARTMLAPQLPLEGAMLRLGAFDGVVAGTALASLVYIRLREREFREDPLEREARGKSEAIFADELADEALARFNALAAAYRNPAKGYLARARPMKSGDLSGDYDHLARTREWAAAEEGEEDEA